MFTVTPGLVRKLMCVKRGLLRAVSAPDKRIYHRFPARAEREFSKGHGAGYNIAGVRGNSLQVEAWAEKARGPAKPRVGAKELSGVADQLQGTSAA